MHDTAIDTPTETAVELVPLKIDFDTVFRGYDRDQVQHYVHATERDTRLLIADRDAALSQAEDLARELGSARATIRRLQATVDQFSRTPPDPGALPERLRRMVELATAEADEITRRAKAAAERTWRHAEDTAARLTERHRELLAELDHRRRTMETEHADLIRRTQADIDRMTREAHQHRAELDRRAEQLRAQAQADFNLAMSARRAELEADLAQRRARADAEFEQHAGALRDEITRLRRLRDAIRGQLGTAERLLADVLTDITDITDIGTEERKPELSLPTQRTGNPATGSTAAVAELAGSTR
ncbi:MAG TPA: cellulose-binding protein [Pseudonocardiaceae bacterium]|nr:cellulose-binding protein [Pseudonocardiaceae bacterium]